MQYEIKYQFFHVNVIDRAKAYMSIYDMVYRNTIAKGLTLPHNRSLNLFPDEVKDAITGVFINRDADLRFNSEGGIVFDVSEITTETLVHIDKTLAKYYKESLEVSD